MDLARRATRYAAGAEENEELLAWLRLEEPEDVLEPELPIVDPHHHLWDRRSDESFAFRSKLYLLPEILEDMYDGHRVVGTVFVEAKAFHQQDGPQELRPRGEVEFCQGVAAACDSGVYGPSRVCWGIQGTCDLRHPNVEAVLLQMTRCRNFRGVRAPGPFDDEFKRGFRALQRLGLVYDRWHGTAERPQGVAYDPDELQRLIALAREFPQVTIVVDHLGGLVGPRMGGQAVVDRWRADVKELADSCPNVVCKVGGIQMASNGWGLEQRATPIGSAELADLVFPWYEHAIRCFGPARCMFESNFPVDKDCVSYRSLWNMFKLVARRMNLSDVEKRHIFHDTAVRVYNLQLLERPPEVSSRSAL